MRTTGLLALVCLLSSLAPAQSERVSGRVTDRSGSPIAGAEVTLVSLAVPMRPELGQPDIVRTQTGDRGRFRCKVATGRLYSAWARLPGKDPVFTNIVEHITGRLVIALEQETFARTSRSVRVTGLEPWKQRAPFRAIAIGSALCSPIVELTLDENGEAKVPDLPGKFCHVELLDRDGYSFLNKRIEFTPQKDRKPTVEIRVAKPLPISVRVLDRESKKPIQGARVLRRAFWRTNYSDTRLLGFRGGRDLFSPAGVTGKDGTCTVGYPEVWKQQNAWRFQLLASAPGYMTGQGALRDSGNTKFYSLEPVEGGPPKLTIELAKGFVLTGRVVDRDAKPIAGLMLMRPLSGAEFVDQSGASWSHHAAITTVTDASGRFEISGLLSCELSGITAVPTDAQAKRLVPAAPDGASPACRLVPLWHDVVDRHDGTKVDLGDLGGAKLSWVRITVADANGEPVPFPNLSVEMANKAENSESGMIDLRGDRRGELVVPLSAGDYRVVNLDADKTGYAFAELTVAPGHADVQVLRLAQKEWAWIEGKVLDSKGRPVAHASIESWGYGVTGRVPNIVPALNQFLLPMTANDKGEFRLPFIPHPGYQFSLAASANGVTGTGQEFNGTGGQTDVVLTVPAR